MTSRPVGSPLTMVDIVFVSRAVLGCVYTLSACWRGEAISYTPKVKKRGSAPKGGAHSTVCFACAASETLENMCFLKYNLLMVWQSTPKVVPRSRISRSAAPFSGLLLCGYCNSMGIVSLVTAPLWRHDLEFKRTTDGNACLSKEA